MSSLANTVEDALKQCTFTRATMEYSFHIGSKCISTNAGMTYGKFERRQFIFCRYVEAAMNWENWPLVTDEPVNV